MTLLLILQVNSFDEQEVSGTNLETTQKFGCTDELQSKKLNVDTSFHDPPQEDRILIKRVVPQRF